MGFYSRRGQVFPLIIAIAAILIIAALISANIGKVSLDRLYCMNAADAGAFAGVSDFICGYNKVRWAHIVMLISWGAIQSYLAWPQIVACWFSRNVWAATAQDLNNTLYSAARPIVRGYSESVRNDAYVFAFNNAGIDDRYKLDPAGQFRDKPQPGESWQDWINLRSAFSQWLRNLPEGWEMAGSVEYVWTNKSKSMRFTCTSSPPQELESRRLPLIGIYWVPTPYGPIYFPLYHGMIDAWLQNPDTPRFVSMDVERVYARPEQDLGFWRVRQPTTRAGNRVLMRGGFTTGFHF